MTNLESDCIDFEKLKGTLVKLCDPSLNFNYYDCHSKQKEQAVAARKKMFNSMVEAIKERFECHSKILVCAANISCDVIDRRLLDYCEYIDDRYSGRLYMDNVGNIFHSIAEVKTKHGDSFVMVNKHQFAESVFIPELDCIVMSVMCVHHQFDPENIDSRVLKFDEPSYIFVTRDAKFVNSYRCAEITQCSAVDNAIDIYRLVESARAMCWFVGDVVNIGGNQYIQLRTINDFIKFMNYKAKLEYKKGKVQNKIDELIARRQFVDTPNPDRMPHEYNSLTCKTNINKIDDDLCVVRWTYSYRDQCFDGMRVYIEGADAYACKRNNRGQFIKVALSTLNQKNFASEYESELIMDDMTGTKLEWYSTVIETLPKQHRLPLLMMFLTDVRLEQLVKLGFVSSICHTMETERTGIGTAVRNKLFISKEHENHKNIYRWMGLNKYQLAKIRDASKQWKNDNELLDIIHDIKQIFDKSDISDFDNNFFDSVFEAYLQYMTDWRRKRKIESWYGDGQIAPHSVNALLKKAKEADATGVFADNLLRYIPVLLRICENYNHIFEEYKDYINMVLQLDIRRQIKLYPTDRNELRIAHDNTTIVYNMAKDDLSRKGFAEHVEKIRVVEYESENFDFCVQAPRCPEDIAVEGMMLNHCVKSYIRNVCDGKTNILFVRKKDERGTPFFTVELKPNKKITQVRGFCNRGMDTEPKLRDFVQEWAKAKKLHVDCA